MTGVSCPSVCKAHALQHPSAACPREGSPNLGPTWVVNFHTGGCISSLPLAGPLSDAGELLKEAVDLVLQVRSIELSGSCAPNAIKTSPVHPTT